MELKTVRGAVRDRLEQDNASKDVMDLWESFAARELRAEEEDDTDYG